MLRALSLGCLLLLAAGLGNAQTPSAERAYEDIIRTYSFDPSRMSFDEQAKLAPGLSALWDRFDKSQAVYEPALIRALQAEGQSEMLYCDGGMLLLHKSKGASGRALGLASISKCSLAEIQHTPYFYTLHELARKGTDTLDLQWKLLSKPRFSAFIVAHALTLGQDYAFVYPLLLQDEDRYLGRIVERLRHEQDPVAQKTLVLAIWYAATPEAERALQDLAMPNSPVSDTVRKESARMLSRAEEARSLTFGAQSALYLRGRTDVTSNDSTAEIRAKRRKRMRSISDEALIELDIYTPLLYRSFK